jgi:hypothetical protein
VTHNTEHAFSLQLATTPDPRIDPIEHVAFKWLSGEDALALASSWSDRTAIELTLARARG